MATNFELSRYPILVPRRQSEFLGTLAMREFAFARAFMFFGFSYILFSPFTLRSLLASHFSKKQITRASAHSYTPSSNQSLTGASIFAFCSRSLTSFFFLSGSLHVRARVACADRTKFPRPLHLLPVLLVFSCLPSALSHSAFCGLDIACEELGALLGKRNIFL